MPYACYSCLRPCGLWRWTLQTNKVRQQLRLTRAGVAPLQGRLISAKLLKELLFAATLSQTGKPISSFFNCKTMVSYENAITKLFASRVKEGSVRIRTLEEESERCAQTLSLREIHQKM